MIADNELDKIRTLLDGQHTMVILQYMGYKFYRSRKFKLREDERTPSASIRADGYIKDFGGNFGGDLIDLLRNKYNTMILSKEETACEIGKVSPATLDRLRQNGEISSRKVLGQIRFSVMEVARFIGRIVISESGHRCRG